MLFHKGSFTDEELGLDPNDPDIVEKRKEALRKLRLARKSEILFLKKIKKISLKKINLI